MALAKTIKFAQTSILLGNGATPTEVFSAPCGFEELTMSININSQDEDIPDCDDPDVAAWVITTITSQQMVLSGNGVLDTDAMQDWQDWWLDNGAEERNVRWFRDLTGANGGGYFQAPAVLTGYEETHARRARGRMSVTLNLNGKPTFTPAS
jgi:hypothetical protein